jgi:hypothetical protein
MACVEETREIDGHSFHCRQLAPTGAIKLQIRLMKVVGPGLAHLTGIQEGDNQKVFEALQAVLCAMSDTEAFSLMNDLVRMAAKDGKMITNLDLDFIDCPLTTVYKVMAFVLEVNFKSFFGALGSFPAVLPRQK